MDILAAILMVLAIPVGAFFVRGGEYHNET